MLSSCLKKADVIALLRAPRGKHINDAVTKEVMRKFSNLVTDVDVQNACDEVGISTKGYTALHGLLKDALRERGITENVFPVPRKVKLARRASNEDVTLRIGHYLHIEETMPSSIFVQSPQRAKKATNAKNRADNIDKGFPYSMSNNIFVDLKKLQQAMAVFYALPSNGEERIM